MCDVINEIVGLTDFGLKINPGSTSSSSSEPPSIRRVTGEALHEAFSVLDEHSASLKNPAKYAAQICSQGTKQYYRNSRKFNRAMKGSKVAAYFTNSQKGCLNNPDDAQLLSGNHFGASTPRMMRKSAREAGLRSILFGNQGNGKPTLIVIIQPGENADFYDEWLDGDHRGGGGSGGDDDDDESDGDDHRGGGGRGDDDGGAPAPKPADDVEEQPNTGGADADADVKPKLDEPDAGCASAEEFVESMKRKLKQQEERALAAEREAYLLRHGSDAGTCLETACVIADDDDGDNGGGGVAQHGSAEAEAATGSELTEAQKEKKKRRKEAKPANSDAPHEAAPINLEEPFALGNDPNDVAALDPTAVRGRVQPGAQRQPAAAGNSGSSPAPAPVPPAEDQDGLKPTDRKGRKQNQPKATDPDGNDDDASDRAGGPKEPKKPKRK